MAKKPETSNSLAEQQLDKAEAQFQAFDENIKQMTQDRLNAAPTKELEPQTKLSQAEIAESKDLYLKPTKSIGSREKFNEKFRDQYNFSAEYVRFIAENKEIIGETIELWTKPFPGMPAEFWKVPTNKPIWGPRHLAEQITRARYHRFVMAAPKASGQDYAGAYYDQMAVDTTIHRLDAMPAKAQKSIFMGASGF